MENQADAIVQWFKYPVPLVNEGRGLELWAGYYTMYIYIYVYIYINIYIYIFICN